MFTGPGQALVLSAALVVFGALLGFPSVLTMFPLNLLLLMLPFGVCLSIPVLHSTTAGRPNISPILLETAGVWTGYAVAFHLYYGFWDGQGIGVGLVGFAVSAPIVVILIRRQHLIAQAEGQDA